MTTLTGIAHFYSFKVERKAQRNRKFRCWSWEQKTGITFEIQNL